MPDRWRSAPWAQNSDRSEKFCNYMSSRSKVDPVWDFRFGLSTETSRPGLSWVFVLVSCNQIKGFVWGLIWTRPGLSSSRSHVITLLVLSDLGSFPSSYYRLHLNEVGRTEMTWQNFLINCTVHWWAVWMYNRTNISTKELQCTRPVYTFMYPATLQSSLQL